ncbi:hypothetical protein SALBM135S_04081 [Streptomyces alboniger]
MKADTVDPKADRPEVPPTDRVPAKPGRGRPLGQKAGRTMHAGPLAYAVLALFTAVSLAPLIWTAIAASRTSGRRAQTPPPLWFGGNLFKNLERALTEASLGDAMLNTTIVAGASPSAPSCSPRSPGSPSPS